MPSWPRLEPTNGALPCLTSMCMRSSRALAMHIQRWSCRYSALVPAGAATVVLAIALSLGAGRQRFRDIDHLVGGQAKAVQVLVVALVKLREVRAFCALLADA